MGAASPTCARRRSARGRRGPLLKTRTLSFSCAPPPPNTSDASVAAPHSPPWSDVSQNQLSLHASTLPDLAKDHPERGFRGTPNTRALDLIGYFRAKNVPNFTSESPIAVTKRAKPPPFPVSGLSSSPLIRVPTRQHQAFLPSPGPDSPGQPPARLRGGTRPGSRREGARAVGARGADSAGPPASRRPRAR